MKKISLTLMVLIVLSINGLLANPTEYLEAHLNNNLVELKWSSNLHKSGGYFVVERSSNAKVWEEIVRVTFEGNQDQQVDFFELDLEPMKGSSYYRLKRISHIGNIRYSNVVPICYKMEKQISELYPLTTDKIICGDANVTCPVGEIYFVVLRDKHGNEYFCKAYITKVSNQLFAEPVSANLPDGSYLVTASDNDLLYSHRLAVSRK